MSKSNKELEKEIANELSRLIVASNGCTFVFSDPDNYIVRDGGIVYRVGLPTRRLIWNPGTIYLSVLVGSRWFTSENMKTPDLEIDLEKAKKWLDGENV